MAYKHLTPEDRAYYDAVKHANSDGTTPGFFKTPEQPEGFLQRLEIPEAESVDIETTLDNLPSEELQRLGALARAQLATGSSLLPGNPVERESDFRARYLNEPVPVELVTPAPSLHFRGPDPCTYWSDEKHITTPQGVCRCGKAYIVLEVI